MAIICVRSTDGNNSNDGSTWSLAKATLAGAFAVAAAGDTICVSQSHAETKASAMVLTSPGTAAAPCYVLCVNDGTESPTTLATTATVTMTAGGGAAITFSGFAYSYGVSYIAGTGTNNSIINIATGQTSFWWKIEAGLLKLAGNSSSSRIYVGRNGASMDDTLLELVNTPMYFSNGYQSVVIRCPLSWSQTPSAVGGTAPGTLFTPTSNSSAYANVVCSGVDLSALGSGKSLVKADQASAAFFYFNNCKLGSSVSILSGAIVGPGGVSVDINNCDSADTNYRMERYRYQGSVKTETTVVMSGGASDGTTPVSWKKTTLSEGPSFVLPLESPILSKWNTTVGESITIGVEIIHDSASPLKDDEIWLEAQSLDSGSYPIATTHSDRKTNILSTAAEQTTSTTTWNGTSGMTNPCKQILTVSLTPQMVGCILGKVCLAIPNKTVYINPVITVT